MFYVMAWAVREQLIHYPYNAKKSTNKRFKIMQAFEFTTCKDALELPNYFGFIVGNDLS
jgi:hypothetical protein